MPIELRRIFNEDRFVERAERGELRMIVKKTRAARMTEIRNWVEGAESQEIHFLDARNNMVAKPIASCVPTEPWPLGARDSTPLEPPPKPRSPDAETNGLPRNPRPAGVAAGTSPYRF